MEKSLAETRKFMEEQVPFNRHIGIRVDTLRRGFARFFMPFRNEFIGDKRRPALHGGVISALIDTCGGAAVWTHFTKEDRISTVDIRVDYLRPGPDDDIIAESEVKRIGNRVGVVHTRVYTANNKDTIIAEVSGSVNVLMNHHKLLFFNEIKRKTSKKIIRRYFLFFFAYISRDYRDLSTR